VRFDSGKTITFTVSNIQTTAPAGFEVTDATFTGFTGITYHLGTGVFTAGTTGVVAYDDVGAGGQFRAYNLDSGFSLAAAAVPEPSSFALFGLAGLSLILRRRR